MEQTWIIEKPADVSYMERQLVTSMIVSDQCLKVIAAVYRPQYMVAKFTRTVAEWCLRYYEQYGRAPRGDIRHIYEAKRQNGLDAIEADLIAGFLAGISREYEGRDSYNDLYFSNQAIEYFKIRGLTLLSDEIRRWLDAGNPAQAQATLSKFQLPSGLASPGCEPFTDLDGCRLAFESLEDPLFEVPGAFGELLQPITRGSLVGLSALYKTGKSWLLDMIGLYAWYSRLNVALFDLEMGELKRKRRLLQSITGLPLKMPRDGRLTVPVWDCWKNQTGECSRRERMNRIAIKDEKGQLLNRDFLSSYRPCDVEGCPDYKTETWFINSVCDELGSWRKSWRKAQQLIEDARGARFKLQFLPARNAALEDLESHLDIWESIEGFVPDVIIVDYPALFKVKGNLTSREKVDETWSALRGLSQKRNCYLLAATQAGGKEVMRKRDSGRDLGQEDVAEDSRIIGHVEAMLKVDQTEDESEIGVARISKSVERHDAYRIRKQVVLLQVLSAGVAVLDSRWK